MVVQAQMAAQLDIPRQANGYLNVKDQTDQTEFPTMGVVISN
jgi:hypothetical protein